MESLDFKLDQLLSRIFLISQHPIHFQVSMSEFRETLLIVLSTPIYVLVIAMEMIFSHFHKKGLYSAKGTFYNIYLMFLNMGIDIILRGACLFVLNHFYSSRLIEIVDPVLYWLVLIIAQDFCFYLLHVVDHHCRLFWAVHVTHHSSEEFNLTVGFRSSVFQPLYRFIYFIPLALAGFKGLDIMFIYSATQIYGILIHTQAVGKLGFLEHILVTPSHHRVHHGSNPIYLDKNMGMLLIVWDKIFGTFQKEEEPVRYGLTSKIVDQDPVNMVFHEWKNLADDLRKPVSVKEKVKYVFYKPGWSHDGSKMTSGQLREKYEQMEGINY